MTFQNDATFKSHLDAVSHRFALGAGFAIVFEEINLEEIDFPLAASTELFRALSPEPNAGFLFTRSTHEGQAQTSLMGWDPFETLTIRQGRVEVATAAGTEISTEPILIAIQKRLDLYRAAAEPSLPDFQGGAFGYFGYDFVRHLEPRLKKSGYFRTLDEDASHVDGELLFMRRLLLLDHEAKKAFVVIGIPRGERVFSQEQLRAEVQSSLSMIEAMKRDIGQALARMSVQPAATAGRELDLSQLQSSLGRQGFDKGVRKLKEGIRDGEIFQAVLSDQFKVQVEADAHEIFSALVSGHQAPYQFHIQNGGRHLLGASPEMLLRIENGTVETHPIAGTRPRGTTTKDDRRMQNQLRRSSKEAAEHLMLVDLARNDLGRVAQPGSVRVRAFRELHQYHSVMHLVSRVEARLQDGRTPLEAFAACFPAGTLSGAPKIRAMELLSEIEKAPRGFYGGAVLALGFSGSLDSCIAIRSLELKDGVATVQAGAGIVADSQAKREFQEIEHKTRAIRVALGSLAVGDET